MAMRRRTTDGSIALCGVGVWRREPSLVLLKPGESGLRINGIAATIANAGHFEHSTCIGRGRQRVKMVEHLLAACAGAGVTDLEIEVSGSELPLLDGSAAPYLSAFRQAGTRPLPGRCEPLVLRSPVVVAGRRGLIAAFPSPRPSISCAIDPPAVPQPQVVEERITPAGFAERIAPARTFGPSPESPAAVRRRLRLPFRLREWNGLKFPARPRLPDEPCRHKLLDIIGDLALLGRPLVARIHAFRPGHRLNQQLVRAILCQLETQ